jgi:hypothetical protein
VPASRIAFLIVPHGRRLREWDDPAVDSEILWRVAVVQVAAVAVLSLLLGLVFSDGFFERVGWLVGPVAWMFCAWVTARVVGLPVEPVLVRALLAGIPSLLFVILGLHWLGAAVAVAIFALWCATLPRPLGGPAASR